MNFKTTYILFGVLSLVLLVFGLSLYLGPTAADSNAFVFPSLHNPIDPVGDSPVVQIEIQRTQPQAEKFVFKKQDDSDRWEILEPRKLRGNSLTIKSMVDSLVRARRDERTDKVGSRESVGLAEPEQKVTLVLKNGKLLYLKVGKTTPGEKSAVTYVTTSDRPGVVQAANKSDLAELSKDLAYFREKELLTAVEGDIRRITISETKEGKEVSPAVELEKRKENWVYVKPFSGDADLQGDNSPPVPGQPPAGQQNILNALINLKADYVSDKENDFVAAGVTDWTKYNLGDKGDLFKITIQRVAPGSKKEADGSDKLETITVLAGVDKKADERSNKYYARRDNEDEVFKVPAAGIDSLRELLKAPDTLRDRHLVRLENFREPDAISIKTDDGLLEFQRPETAKPWIFYRGDVKQSLNEGMIKGLLIQLQDRRKDISFLDSKTVKETDLGLDKPVAVLNLWVDGLDHPVSSDDKADTRGEKDAKKPEEGKLKLKTPDKPAIRLTFAPKRGGMDTVVKSETEGAPPVYMRVPDKVYELVTQGPLAYLDRRLPKVWEGMAEVGSLLVDQGGKILEVKREKPGEGAWKIVQPKNWAGRDADTAVVNSILLMLNNLEAEQLITDKPSPEDLERRFGLKSPSGKAVVTLIKDGKPVEKTLSLGKEQGANLYARLTGSDIVFSLAKSKLAPFNDSILDKTVFRFDPAKVTEIKLTRWNKDLEAPSDQVLVKDGSDWKVKGSDQKLPKPQRYNDLIGTLATGLKASQFIDGAVKPEYDFESSKGALQIEVTVTGEKQPFQLLLGKEDGAGYFARSPQMGDQLFVVNKTPFKEFR